ALSAPNNTPTNIINPTTHLVKTLYVLSRPPATVVRREGPRDLPASKIADWLDDRPGRGVDQVVQHFFDGPLVTGLKARLLLADTLQAAIAISGGTLCQKSQAGQTFGGLVADVGEGLLCPFVLLDHRATPL